MTRKVIQIGIESDRVYALCDDGTLWVCDVIDPSSVVCKWEKLPEIPQGEVPGT